ncbi:unnamed protein product [Caenorhabditis sp. 36 PRJEB53466]|nr:unnamed protein product [Caenorhabditis sp. 36 PRJEB53466]
MYREMLNQGIELYCEMWPCDRECGKFHERFINTTKLRRMRTLSESIDHAPIADENRAKAKGVFEEIMEMAARKDSQKFIEVPLPPLPEEYQAITFGSGGQKPRGSDTTMIFFDNPVWDDAKFRQELLDSDDEKYSIGDAPYIMDDDDTLDNILRDTHHESASNPIEHYQTDETILTDDDEHDYSSLDLSKTANGGSRVQRQPFLLQTLRSPDAKYEKSLTDI